MARTRPIKRSRPPQQNVRALRGVCIQNRLCSWGFFRHNNYGFVVNNLRRPDHRFRLHTNPSSILALRNALRASAVNYFSSLSVVTTRSKPLAVIAVPYTTTRAAHRFRDLHSRSTSNRNTSIPSRRQTLANTPLHSITVRRSAQTLPGKRKVHDSIQHAPIVRFTGHIDITKPLLEDRFRPPIQLEHKAKREASYINTVRMKAKVQVLTTPTADTPGTSLLLHFDNKRYLIGSLAEGTQRSCIQMGARMLKVRECFITGRTEWKNTGGLIGMILTLADAAASSRVASRDEAKRKAFAKAKRLGIENDPEKIRELEKEAQNDVQSGLTLFAPPNLNHFLATARRFVFRKGMPIDVHEIKENEGKSEKGSDWEPYWVDENVKVWAMSVTPSKASARSVSNGEQSGTSSPRKRSFEEMHDETDAHSDSERPSKVQSQMTAKAVVSEMFNSTWRLDTLFETPLSEVKLPATMFVRNPSTGKIEKYTGPLPGDKTRPLSDPNMTVLVRKPWPGALVESLPPTQPAKEAVSYIIRCHTQRGRFHPERAIALKVEKGFKWAQLTSGNSVQNVDGETVTPEQVLGESKIGGGLAIVDLPDPSYIEPLLARKEWREASVMVGVGAIVWICGNDVAIDPRLRAFMEEFKGLQHVVSSPEHCPDQIALDSVAASTTRLRKIDPKRFTIPIHQNEPQQPPSTLPEGVHVASRGQVIDIEPAIGVDTKLVVPQLDIAAIEAEMAQDVLDEGAKCRKAATNDSDIERWASTLPPDVRNAEVITLGTGSALPSKYRNVSATLVRVPGWGNMLFDCGENTLGQLKRVFKSDELRQLLRDLRMIVISHMHADHHLGTVGVIRAWYETVHKSQPLPTGIDLKATFNEQGGLTVVSEPAMAHWLAEYSAVEDYGFSRIAPICSTAANPNRDITTSLSWFVPSHELSKLSPAGRYMRLSNNVLPASFFNLVDLQTVAVKHCHGARAISITFPSGFKASYSGDCRPSRNFAQIGKGSTVCIHEATFDDELQGDAQAKNHSTTSEALGIAQAMGARACILTHFSQRYQKLPVIERTVDESEPESALDSLPPGTEDEDAEMSAAAGPIEDGEGPPRPTGDDTAPTLPAQQTSGEGQRVELPPKSSGPPEAVKFKLASDMKVGVAFDYMRVKIGEMAELEKFTPALLKLFAEEEKEPENDGLAGGDDKEVGGGDGKQKNKNKKDRNGRKNKNNGGSA